MRTSAISPAVTFRAALQHDHPKGGKLTDEQLDKFERIMDGVADQIKSHDDYATARIVPNTSIFYKLASKGDPDAMKVTEVSPDGTKKTAYVKPGTTIGFNVVVATDHDVRATIQKDFQFRPSDNNVDDKTWVKYFMETIDHLRGKLQKGDYDHVGSWTPWS